MFNFKSQLLGAAAVLPIVAAGLLGSAGSAEAAALTGAFSFNGGTTVNPFANTTITLFDDGVTFAPQPITPISITTSNIPGSQFGGSFSAFNSADINNIVFGNVLTNPVLDLGYLTIPGDPASQSPGFVLPGTNTSSITDNQNIFTSTNSFYTLEQIGNLVVANVHLTGYFTSATGEISNGEGVITFQSSGAANLASVETMINSSTGWSGLTFSGSAFTASVPEPTTILGLGLVAAGMTVARRRKAVKA